MAAGRGSIATSSRVSCIRLTTDATPTTKPIPSFGSRRRLPRLRTEILRRRRGRNTRAVVGRPPALPDTPSAVVHSLAADRCAALSQASSGGTADRHRPGQTRCAPGPVRRVGNEIPSTCSTSQARHSHQGKPGQCERQMSHWIAPRVMGCTRRHRRGSSICHGRPVAAAGAQHVRPIGAN